MKTTHVFVGVALIGGVLLIGFAAVCGGVLFLGYRDVEKNISPKIDELFAAIEDGTFGETYANATTAELRNVTSQEEYEQTGAAVSSRLGKLQSKKLVRFNSRQSNVTRNVDVVYSASFDKGEGTIQARFKRTGSEWRLVTFHVNSPEFTKDLAADTCRHCGSPHSASASFCPACGKPIGGSGQPSETIGEDKGEENVPATENPPE